MKAVIDTCVILDAIQERKPFYEDAQALIIHNANKQYQGYLTAKALTDIYYLTHRQLHSDKDTREVISKLCKLFGIIDTAAIDVRRAIFSEISDYEDAVMVESAVRSGMDCIVTRNIKDYSKANIAVYTPDEFISILTH